MAFRFIVSLACIAASVSGQNFRGLQAYGAPTPCPSEAAVAAATIDMTATLPPVTLAPAYPVAETAVAPVAVDNTIPAYPTEVQDSEEPCSIEDVLPAEAYLTATLPPVVVAEVAPTVNEVETPCPSEAVDAQVAPIAVAEPAYPTPVATMPYTNEAVAPISVAEPAYPTPVATMPYTSEAVAPIAVAEPAYPTPVATMPYTNEAVAPIAVAEPAYTAAPAYPVAETVVAPTHGMC